ncbi:NAD(P)/FAD-dependent oxidoreductase [Paraliobacillus sp. X-1268]|uniref:NAD(P)/FAD-dependent oxidoreductase n=1 Tax=Paraliobacillus sp. X-1268 TaxID=2213193 RepID=UPI000E3CF567|nr:FAD-dependent oxidoreductase [Paraliobacillus sp. X-1268]
MSERAPIVIVGAGMSGIMAARTLKEKGYQDILLVEKSRSVGGRMATRRIEKGKIDHGAQFFTVRTKKFQTFVDEWIENANVKHWFGDDYYRYMSVDGMNAFAKKLAEDISVRLQKRITEIKKNATGYILTTDEGEAINASAVIVTAPAPRAKTLLENDNLKVDAKVLQKLDEIVFQPCLVGLFHLQQHTNLPNSGHLDSELPEGVMRLVDHKKKGISEIPTISVYMTGEWSKAHYQLGDEAVLEKIKQITSAYINFDSALSSQLKKWHYAEAVQFLRQPFLNTNLEYPLLVAGDAFLHSQDPANRTRLESAFISGITVGEELVKLLK